MSFSKVLVLGGAGFVGSWLTRGLLSTGSRIIILDNLSSGNIDNIPSDENVTFVKGDVMNKEVLKRLVSEADHVFHLAEFIPNYDDYGPGHVIRYSTEAPIKEVTEDFTGTINLLESIRNSDKGVTFVSTAAVYGIPKKNPVREDDPPMPVSPYGVAKLCCEEYCRMYARLYGINVVIPRLFNVFGERQTKYVMYDFLRKAKAEGEVRLFGREDAVRDFIYAPDAVTAILTVSRRVSKECKTFNIGTGKGHEIGRVVKELAEIAGLKKRIVFSGESWPGNVSQIYADVSELTKLGFKTEFSIEKGMSRLVKWFSNE